jgi:hypothetical protein
MKMHLHCFSAIRQGRKTREVVRLEAEATRAQVVASQYAVMGSVFSMNEASQQHG